METWSKDNLPENHQMMENIQFVAVTEGTWKRKKNDGTDEVVPKWNFISAADKEGASLEVQVYSATDKEELAMNTPYDIIVKRAVGKDGTFYGYTIKGFAPHGEPIKKKEPQSRFQKGFKLNAKVEGLKAAVQVFAPSEVPDVNAIIEVATAFENYIDGKDTATSVIAKKDVDKLFEK